MTRQLSTGWVEKYSPELEKRIRLHRSPVGKSWRVDKTYIKNWNYLYRAIDYDGNTIDFRLSASRNRGLAARLFKKNSQELRQPSSY